MRPTVSCSQASDQQDPGLIVLSHPGSFVTGNTSGPPYGRGVFSDRFFQA